MYLRGTAATSSKSAVNFGFALRADRMSSAMSVFEIAKEAGSIGAASGGSPTRQPEPTAKLRPAEPQRRLQARLEEPLALRRVEPCPSLHRALEQIGAPHLATFQNENSANEPQKSKLANMLAATKISTHDVAVRTVLREGAAVSPLALWCALFQLASSAFIRPCSHGSIAVG